MFLVLTRIPDIELNQKVRNTGDFKKIFDQEQAEYALDLRMFFNVSQLVSEAEEGGGGGPEAGGQTVYIARGEDEELVTVAPGENTLSLVYRLEQLQIHKYFF